MYGPSTLEKEGRMISIFDTSLSLSIPADRPMPPAAVIVSEAAARPYTALDKRKHARTHQQRAGEVADSGAKLLHQG